MNDFSTIWATAHEAGLASAAAAKPVPMIVGTPTTPFGSDIDPTKPVYYEAGGVCGFAWVSFAGNTAFGRWAKANGLATKAYGGGLQFSVRVGGQSMQTKEAYAHAFADTLRNAGIKAYASSRMD